MVTKDERAAEAATQPPRAAKAELPSCLQGAGPAAPPLRSAGSAGAAAAPGAAGGPGRRPAGRETRGASRGAGGRCGVAGLLRPAGRRRPRAGEPAKGARPERASHSAGAQGPRKLGIPPQGGERRHGNRRLPRPATGRDWESRRSGEAAGTARVGEEVGERRGGRPRAHAGRRALRGRGPQPPGQPRHLSEAPIYPTRQSLGKGLTGRRGRALHRWAHACTRSPSSPGGPVPNSPRDKARAQPLLGTQAKKCSETWCCQSA